MGKNNVALVTGGTGGIGEEICRQLAATGCKVVANYFPADKENAESWQAAQKEAGFDIELAPCDVTDFDATGAMIADIQSNVGPIDVLVNCAGITRDATIKNMDIDAWKAVIDTNLTSAFNVTKPVLLGMTERGYGRIINISSVNGQRGQFGQPNYSAAKAGIHGFTMSAAYEGARKGVTVNTVAPGYVSTAMTEAMPENVLASIIGGIPMGRMAQPAEIASAVLWLSSEDNSYTTGACIPVNGGLFVSH
ncbi:3-ketoacyl-ACP reductase [Cocleimonas flava]|uniref:3-oxoacyl-[acyl-carrier-protein] reductase n=1 Tax=Cocleimonas flava TaxID=634765 RepID=A0A4R1F4M3_9GAMM|nr:MULTISPECIES: acetoacetyl-CoA reductase [Cocleimonas]MEB8434435.1 acetoacetyl-CoA reductase [Cocleimonas sp. KMM 6892]MEC4717328.1 acetoacetyl-CoA reductase [Cocleimonas sp. KMM 6895]MEC4746707.1 acetoacetyl-CoA reductase [Cocleimonas sp. KMM 6896]TCJ87469.1 3-oxoacyl-[acyl-carrier-protein] reductase [Cocleimonas flava]